jgi:HD-like signal output (HDOD) protein
VSGDGTVLTKTQFQTQVSRNPLVERQPLQVEVARELPDVPVLTQTLLILELLLQEPCVDLREVTHVVLGDLGATLQILRLAGREYGNGEGRPTRIEDCIADIGLEACLRAVSAQTIAHDGRRTAIGEFWAHSREIAEYSRMVAQDMPGINPEEAYLTGLLHALGMLPGLLGWREAGITDGALAGLRIAKRWSLPDCIMEFFNEMHLTGYATRWSGIVQKAHLRATRSAIDCPFEQSLRPQLHRDGAREPEAVPFFRAG